VVIVVGVIAGLKSALHHPVTAEAGNPLAIKEAIILRERVAIVASFKLRTHNPVTARGSRAHCVARLVAGSAGIIKTVITHFVHLHGAIAAMPRHR
jgi:hypothetical protein